MSEKNNTNQNQNDFDAWVNSTGDFARLSTSNGETQTYQFYPGKRELVTRDFADPITKEVRPTVKARYKVTVPDSGDSNEKSLDCPKTLAQAIEANLAKNHTLLEITRHGVGVNTRYSVVAA